MDKTCPCGKIFFVKIFLLKRKKYCCKKCFYEYRVIDNTSKKYILKKKNPTWFKKGQKPWNTGLPEHLQNTWKGDKVGYWGIHSWIEKHRGKPRKCENCRTTKAKKFDWSNKSGKYFRKLSDWQRLCVRCHFYYDKEKFGTRESFHR